MPSDPLSDLSTLMAPLTQTSVSPLTRWATKASTPRGPRPFGQIRLTAMRWARSSTPPGEVASIYDSRRSPPSEMLQMAWRKACCCRSKPRGQVLT